MKAQQHLVLTLTAWFCTCLVPGLAAAAGYDLQAVKGIEAFGGSAEARALLAKNGFVVADPAFMQIFEPYIRGESLPSFITTDSAWHTYHVLLEEGVKNLEEVQSQRLLRFSRRLWRLANEQKTNSNAADLLLYASVGLALQDEQHRKGLAPEEKRIVDGLRTGTPLVEVPIGFSLAPVQFRAQSFYTQSPELSDYFAARQWFASVVFRLTNARETRLAVALAGLVNGDTELLALWKQLSTPFDTFLAPAEDGTISQYFEAAKAVVGPTGPVVKLTDAQLARIQKQLQDQLPLPRVSDQQLTPEHYLEFARQTRGFRLLPPRRLPCAVCFHNTVDPKIPNRQYPSGLDFLAASPVLRSPAAVRAVESQFGKSVSELILKADCGPMPDSLHGEAMQLLALLQKPLPAQAPASMRNDAWSDLQLWTQLGAWAEQRHTWALHTKLSVMVAGMITPPKGMVAPYPEFFSGLAALTRRTATAFEMAGLDQPFEIKTTASNLLDLLNLSQERSHPRNEKEFKKNSSKLEQLEQFQNRYYEQHKAELENGGTRDAWKKLQDELKDMAQRCAASGKATEAETETLRSFYECRQDIVRLLRDFAPVCDRLAELAKKSLAGQALSEDDGKWVENYGVTLAGFHFYYNNSYEVPRDDFPLVTRVFSHARADSMLYAGLARPQALYVIASDGKANQLYRGAVLTYREFVRPNNQLLDDHSWRGLVGKGQTPPAPPFTASFYAETSVPELIKRLQAQSASQHANYRDLTETLWQIDSRATAKDLPQLLQVLTCAQGEGRGDLVEGMAEIIARLPWEPYRKPLIELLAASDSGLADAAARILAERPASLDPAVFISGFAQQPTRTRRLYCALLSRVPQQTESTHKLFLQGLHDPADGVRWQAALAMATAQWKDAQSSSALLESLNDTNEFVGSAAAHALAQLGATNAAPALVAKLQSRLQAAASSPEELERQASAVMRDARYGFDRSPQYQLLAPDDLEMSISMRVPKQAKQMATMRLPPHSFALPTHDYTLADALIEALGDLGYAPAAEEFFKLRGTDYEAIATRALRKIVPERLAAELLATAKDTKTDSYFRERALVTLCNLSMTNRVRELVPLLEDLTPIAYSPIAYSRPLPGPEWRVCDRAAVSIATMLGWEYPTEHRYLRPEQREELMQRAHEWAKSNP